MAPEFRTVSCSPFDLGMDCDLRPKPSETPLIGRCYTQADNGTTAEGGAGFREALIKTKKHILPIINYVNVYKKNKIYFEDLKSS